MKRILNDLEISFETNEIIVMNKNDSHARTKVEPRIMRVLQILMNNSPNVVSRDQLISEVWDNYGGADDALNQAISHLRKLLNDNNKEDRIIETVIKKGYRFKGEAEIVNEERINLNYKQQKTNFKIAIITIVFLSLAFIIYLMTLSNSNVPKAPVDKKSNSTISAPDFE